MAACRPARPTAMNYLTPSVYIAASLAYALSATGCSEPPTCKAFTKQLRTVGEHVEIIGVMEAAELEQACTSRKWLDNADNDAVVQCIMKATDATSFDGCSKPGLVKLLGS